jgi:hypothetical protein
MYSKGILITYTFGQKVPIKKTPFYHKSEPPYLPFTHWHVHDAHIHFYPTFVIGQT